MSAPVATGLTPQEAALRGASLAFQKQQQGPASANGGSVSRQTTGSAGGEDGPAERERERERERQALFLPSSLSTAAAEHGAGGVAHHAQRLAPPGGRAAAAAAAAAGDLKSASFIAATLAASRSVSPGTRSDSGAARRPSLRGSETAAADTTSLRPATSLISLFESHKHADEDPVGGSPVRAGRRRQKPRCPQPPVRLEREGEGLDRGSPRSKTKPSLKPKPKPKVQVGRRDETPPPPVVRRADTEIVSPKPRRPEKKPKLEVDAAVSGESSVSSDAAIQEASKAKPRVPKPRTAQARHGGQTTVGREENQTTKQRTSGPAKKIPSKPTKTRPPAPRKSADLSERLPLETITRSPRGPSEVSNTDGPEESEVASAENTKDVRPSTADSKSSDDSFVSASSVPTRDETDSLLTVRSPTPSSLTPRVRLSRPVSAQPLTPALPIRRSATGSSSQLPLDSLSDAIMAGSLASARHTPVSIGDSRTPPPLPPSRRGTTKNKSSSRRQSPHRMKHTLRQPPSLSDDEDARRPHHHRRRGLNRKKHAHHEGSRRRWREEITEREKKRYEAVWASNRGLFLVPPPAPWPEHPADHNRARRPRDERSEALSDLIADVVVRDLWSRSRLPAAELAEVWDLVYGRGRGAGRESGAPAAHGALDKQEFVVGMWLIDQRLRGRKIPPWVSESVWDSAKGLRVLSPEHGHGHKGKG